MEQKISVNPSTPAHYKDILNIFNEGFSSKFNYVTRKIDQQLSFARDFGLFDIEAGDREFSAIIDGRVLGFLSLRFARQSKRKAPRTLSNRELFRKYGLISIIKAISFVMIFYHKVKEDELYIDTVGVAVEARGQGIGTHLLDFSEAFAKERGLRTLTLMVIYENPKAKALYERCGYRVKSSHSLMWMKRSTGISGAYYMVRNL
ncbi:MAG: GNAT family N-acetyltransferase [Spirochaetia bacterium]|nr:GNAT family N-acetyltransferase [Spirochaetia bacterium]